MTTSRSTTKTLETKKVTNATEDKNFMAVLGLTSGAVAAPVLAVLVFIMCWLCFCCFLLTVAAFS